MRVRLRHGTGCMLPSGLCQGDEVQIMRLDGFVVVVRDDAGRDYPVAIHNIVAPKFVFLEGRWVTMEEAGHRR